MTHKLQPSVSCITCGWNEKGRWLTCWVMAADSVPQPVLISGLCFIGTSMGQVLLLLYPLCRWEQKHREAKLLAWDPTTIKWCSCGLNSWSLTPESLATIPYCVPCSGAWEKAEDMRYGIWDSAVDTVLVPKNCTDSPKPLIPLCECRVFLGESGEAGTYRQREPA